MQRASLICLLLCLSACVVCCWLFVCLFVVCCQAPTAKKTECGGVGLYVTEGQVFSVGVHIIKIYYLIYHPNIVEGDKLKYII